MTHPGRLLLAFALALPCCSSDAFPTYCLMPIELAFSREVPAYEFVVVGRYVADGTTATKSAACPSTFSGGDCDERGIVLRDFDNQDLALALKISVVGEVVFDREIMVDAAGQCSSGIREVPVEL